MEIKKVVSRTWTSALAGGTLPSTSIGKTISSTDGFTTTVLGSYGGEDKDMFKILEFIGNLKSYNFKEKDGGFNVLNVPDIFNSRNKDGFWENYNLPFLEEAISRGDRIVLATNPLQLDKVFNKLDDIPEINSVEELTEFLKEYNIETNLRGFGKELKYLFDKEYTYDAVNNVFKK